MLDAIPREAPEREPSRDQAGALGTRHRIRFDRRLGALDAPFAKAFEAVDLEDSSAALYALVCAPGRPHRQDALATLRTLRHPQLLRVAAEGVVARPGMPARAQAIVIDRPAGGRLMEPGASGPAWSEEDVVERALPALVKGLAALHGRGVAHRALRPDNLFFIDSARTSVVLGECASAPAGATQPATFEPIERAMAQPSGRGEGGPDCDLFALGVTLLALLRGETPLAELDEARAIERRLAEGSHDALVGAHRFRAPLADLLGGLLCDLPKNRWTIERLEAWLAGRRGGPPATEPRRRSLQPYAFGGVDYDQPRALAWAFARDWHAARRSVREGRLARWLERSVNRPDAAEAVARALAAADGAAGRRRLGEDDLVARICIILDPEGPIRYRGFRAMPDGFGPALAWAMNEGRDEAVQTVAQVIASGLPAQAVAALPGGRGRHSNLLGGFVKMEALLRDRSRGYGIERCLYELNPSLACQSPRIVGQAAGDLGELLRALDAAAADAVPAGAPVDRHVAAFLGSRLAIRDQAQLRSLGDPGGDPAREAIAQLTMLALAQQRARIGRLADLAGWVAGRVRPVARGLRNRGLRRRVESEIGLAAAGGSLARLFQVVTDPARRRRDRQGFRRALARRAAIRAELDRIETSTPEHWRRAAHYGRRLAAGTAYLLLGGALFGFVFRGLL